MRRARAVASRLVLAFLALQVLSGLVILFAIAWCLLEIYRHPSRSRSRRARPVRRPVTDWYELEVDSARLRTARFAVEHVELASIF